MKTYRIIKKTTPGHKQITRKVKQKPHRVSCGITGEQLHGIKAIKRSNAKKSAKSSKKVNRKYGGAYSSRVARELIRTEARENV